MSSTNHRSTFLTYVGVAFRWHWNLLALGGCIAFAFLSGLPGLILPLLGAAEIAYLGLLSTHPRFRKSVDARRFKDTSATERELELHNIMSVLSEADAHRFQSLRERCAVLNRLARQFRSAASSAEDRLGSMHVDSLERLLWMFLKLLYSKDAVIRFLEETDREALVAEIAESEKQVETLKKEARRENLIRSLEDKLATMRQRLANYDASRENFELIVAELDRIEQKIAAVSEMSLQRPRPRFHQRPGRRHRRQHLRHCRCHPQPRRRPHPPI